LGLIAAGLIDRDIITYVLWVLAALASFTAVQRLAIVWAKAREMNRDVTP
jgi:hypothetical protein